MDTAAEKQIGDTETAKPTARPKAKAKPAASVAGRVGILLVHRIGERKRLEHRLSKHSPRAGL